MPISQNVIACSVLATFHQAFQRTRFSSVSGNVVPVDGTASCSPVIGETIRGM